MTVAVAAASDDVLGEGPVYDRADGSLRWVDIGRGLWRRLDLKSGAHSTIELDEALTGFAPVADGGYVGAFKSGIARFGHDGRITSWLARPEAGIESNRFNDAGTDLHGRFLAGTMNMHGGEPKGALYSLDDQRRLSVLKRGIGIANTIAFNPSGDILYTADTSTGDLMAFDYDAATGKLGERRGDFRPDPSLPGAPDGSAVDAEGYLWNARWDGGCVVRLAPDGALDRIVEMPVRLVTSCCFVGTALYVTTSTWNFSDEDRRTQPLAGSLLKFDADVAGLERSLCRIGAA